MLTAKRFLALLLLIFSVTLQAQTPTPANLTLSVKWADGAKCACTLTVTQMGSLGVPDVVIFNGATGASGGLSTNLPLDPQQMYVILVHSNDYGMDIYSFVFESVFMTTTPLASINFKLVFTRPPSVNPPVLPTMTTGTSISVSL